MSSPHRGGAVRDGRAVRWGPSPLHKHLEDRYHAPLEFREWLFIAMVKRAIHLAQRRRRRAGVKLENVLAVADRGEIWLQRRQEGVLAIYGEQLRYLERRRPTCSTKTLTRNVNAMKDQKLIKVDNYSRYDHRRGKWVQMPNVYTITRAGILWIRRNARALKIPSVV